MSKRLRHFLLTVSATCSPNLESDSKYRASYLDLLMKINDGKVVTSLYDKRDGFNFKILKFPDLRGNVPSRRFHNHVLGELIRITRACENGPDIYQRFRKLCRRLLGQGWKRHMLRGKVFKFFEAYRLLLPNSMQTNTTMEHVRQVLPG